MSARPPLRVGLVWSPRGWAARIHGYATDHVAEVEMIVVRDRRAALESDLAVLVVDETTPWLNTALIDQAEHAGVTVVGVWDTAEPTGEARLIELGLSHRMVSTIEPTDAVYLLQRLRPRTDGFHELVASIGDAAVGERGAVLVVGGPPGAGARELGIGLAASFSTTRSTLLVDANESSPGVARRLGLGLYPHLMSAVDGLRRNGPPALAESIAKTARGDQPTYRFDTVVGLPSPAEWERLSPRSVEDLLEAARQTWDRTVVATSPVIEDMRRWADRYGTSRHLLAGVGDELIAVCEATPRGVLRFTDWLAELAPIQTRPGPIPVVMNRASATKAGTAELLSQLSSICGDAIGVVAVLPGDDRVAVADWNAELPRTGPFTKAVGKLTETLDGVLDARRARMVMA